jgi:5-hydroxyisourate hydrolase-like protein (transthyretin family)
MMFDKIDATRMGIDKDEAAQARKSTLMKEEGEHRNWMAMTDADQDGRVSTNEYARHCQTMFDKIDTNKDGYIDKAERHKRKRARWIGLQ